MLSNPGLQDLISSVALFLPCSTSQKCDIDLFTFTRSYAALRAADLDWIVGPGYSSGREHYLEKPQKTNLEPRQTNLEPWKTMETNQKPWKILKLRDVTHMGSQLTSIIKKTWRDPHGVPTDLLDV